MHVLSIAPILPYPPNHGWRVRTWHLLRALSQHHDVTLLTWVPPDEPEVHLDEVRTQIGDLIALPLGGAPRGRMARLRRHVEFLGGGLPTYVQEMFDERNLRVAAGRAAMTRSVAEVHDARPVDVVVFEEEAMRLMPPLPLPGVPVAVHRLEVFEPLMRELRSTSVPGRAYSLVESRRWAWFDRAVMEHTDLVVSTSPQTVVAVAPYHDGLPTVVVPNGVELRRLRTRPSQGADVAVLGSMDYGPNVDGAVWFVRSVWPAVRAANPSARLRIVGRDPSPAILQLRSDAVEVTGTVPDVTAACEGVRVGVVPLRSGMGIKNKTLDFMSMGLPVVTTPHGAEGVAATADDGMATLPLDADRISRAVNDLLADGERADRLGDAAHEYVRAHHSWDAIGAAYSEDLETLVRAR